MSMKTNQEELPAKDDPRAANFPLGNYYLTNKLRRGKGFAVFFKFNR